MTFIANASISSKLWQMVGKRKVWRGKKRQTGCFYGSTLPPRGHDRLRTNKAAPVSRKYRISHTQCVCAQILQSCWFLSLHHFLDGTSADAFIPSVTPQSLNAKWDTGLWSHQRSRDHAYSSTFSERRESIGCEGEAVPPVVVGVHVVPLNSDSRNHHSSCADGKTGTFPHISPG